MKMRRRGLVVYLTAETPEDDRKLSHIAQRYGRHRTAGFGKTRLTFDLPDDFGVLCKVLRYIWGIKGSHRVARLAKIITASYGAEK